MHMRNLSIFVFLLYPSIQPFFCFVPCSPCWIFCNNQNCLSIHLFIHSCLSCLYVLPKCLVHILHKFFSTRKWLRAKSCRGIWELFCFLQTGTFRVFLISQDLYFALELGVRNLILQHWCWLSKNQIWFNLYLISEWVNKINGINIILQEFNHFLICSFLRD